MLFKPSLSRDLETFGGAYLDFFVKLDFEIAVDQQTRTHDGQIPKN